jgi:hypothetical protein
MLVGIVAARPRGLAIAAALVETAAALDTVSPGLIFPLMVDEPALAADVYDALIGEPMVEAAVATDAWNAGIASAVAVLEATSAADALDAAIIVAGANIARTAEQNGTSDTFTNASIGPAAAGRLVWVAVAGVNAGGSNRTLTGLTIGGTAATIHDQIQNVGMSLAICSLVVAAGTTATIVATWSGALTERYFAVGTLTGYGSATPHQVSKAAADNLTLNIPAGGAALALAASKNGTIGAFTFSGLTEGTDVLSSTAISRFGTAMDYGLGMQTARPVSATSTATNETMIAASWA